MSNTFSTDTPFFGRPLFFFDQGRFRQSLWEASGKSLAASLSVFKDAMSAANTQFDVRFREGEDIRSLIYERALFIDCILHYSWHQFDWEDSIALLAVGGYGRGELHPFSDIDLLILLQDDETHKRGDTIQSFLAFLWDIGLEIGYSVRTIDQCVDIAGKDITVATNLLECRTLLGNEHLRDKLITATGPDKLWPADTFFSAKRDEQLARHRKHHNTEYNLEPNIKNAPGGLRDIQVICWVAKRFFGVRTLKQLDGKGFFTEEEFAILLRGEEFLWKVRYGLHMIAGRAEERLLFDHQRELASLFGFNDSKRLAVEQFMRDYYRVVLALRELNDVMLNFLDEAILHRGQCLEVSPINERFQLRDNYIEATYTRVFEDDPSALLEVFVLMGKNPNIQGVRASTIRLIRENRDLIDDEFRQDPDNKALFLEFMRSPHKLVSLLRSMKRYRILGRYLPEFGRIIGQMQHDLFHIYTVDAHTLLLIRHMRRFLNSDLAEKFPIATKIMKRIEKPELLYITGLYHDIAKGRGGDHSALGAVDAENFCLNHGLSARETRLICWLVEKHLVMSAVSQKQDLSDPEVIHNFAAIIGDRSRLDYLYVLTVADINATNPDLWTSWRASLMRQLYEETKRALRRGLENPVDPQELIEETQQTVIQQLAEEGISEAQTRECWGSVGDSYFLRESAADITWQTRAIIDANEDDLIILIKETSKREHEGATEIFICTPDRENIFAAVANTLDQLDLNIQDARIYISDTGYTIDTFYVLDENGESIGNDEIRLEHIRSTLHAELSPSGDDADITSVRTPRQLKSFTMPTRTSISSDIQNGFSILEVISPDRPGLLARIGGVFLQFGIHLKNAKIATLGERVEDIFFISDKNGQPLTDPTLCQELQDEICRQLDEKVESDTNGIY